MTDDLLTFVLAFGAIGVASLLLELVDEVEEK
jgi:hypothetical protein